MNFLRIFIIIFCPTIFLLSCNTFIGYKNINKVSFQKISETCHQYNLTNCFIADAEYLNRLRMFFTDSLEIKNLYQPLQVQYFIDDTLRSTLINCYIEPIGIAKFDWNHNQRLSKFPPDSPIKFHKPFVINEYLKLFGIHNQPNSKNVVCIIWSNCLPKQSKELLKQITQSIRTLNISNCEIISINNDALFINR